MRGERGFTLIELVVAMTILSMISLALAGVISIGARSAASGERKTEQSRRFRVATDLLVRQLRSTVALEVITEDEDELEPYFFGNHESISFVTALAQSPNATGFAVVNYWYEDGTLMMSELPYFATFAGDTSSGDLDHLTFSTTLLYDVREVRFEYRRSDFGDDTWSERWDAIDEEALPAAVRVRVEPSAPGGPTWEHEIPVFVGVLNEVTGEDDFERPRSR